MSILRRQAIPPYAFVIRQYDIKVMLSVVVLSRVFLIALYLASGGPGLSGADLTIALALP